MPDNRECVVDGCGRQRYWRSEYCVMHYARVKRNGDPNIRHKTTPKDCAYCGKTFAAKNKCAPHKYCSEECRATDWRNKRTESTKEKRNCLYCGNEFMATTWPSNNHYCSGVCKGKHNAVNRVRNATCRKCGIEYETPNSHFNTCPVCARENMLNKVKRRNRIVREMRRGTLGPYHKHGDWLKLLNRFDGKCAYCGENKAEHRDHVIPISRGGTDSIGNILPACRDCNLSKCDKTIMEWRIYRQRKGEQNGRQTAKASGA